MLVLNNGNRVMAEAGKPLGNNEVNVLRFENTDFVAFGIVTTGPIRVYYGDGSYSDVGVKSTRYDITKIYDHVGTWNIVINNVENIAELVFDNANTVEKINTPASWFCQFVNITNIRLVNASFVGELSDVINKLILLNSLTVFYTKLLPLTFNVSNCKKFWTLCKSVEINFYTATQMCYGSLTDINVNPDCIRFTILAELSGNTSGIIKSTYTKIETLTFNAKNSSGVIFSFSNIDELIIPATLNYLTIDGGKLPSKGVFKNFNFKNLQKLTLQSTYQYVELTNSLSYIDFATKCTTCYLTYMGNTPVTVDLNRFTRVTSPQYSVILMCNDGYNASWGDITNLLNNSSSLCITGGKNDNSIYGTLANTCKCNYLWLIGLGVTISADVFKTLASSTLTNGIILRSLNNFSGDISNTNFVGILTHYEGFTISYMPNLYCDITTLQFNTTFYLTAYLSFQLNNNPHFSGNLANLQLWGNKKNINLSNCSYTNVPGFVRKVFDNRNTCLKASGGMTAIYVQGNVDNASLTGTFQQPNLGTYTGNMDDLTESQIDNLAQGLDYTGTGTNTPWTDKEKIWFLINCKNSSTDTSLRYRVTINY